MGTVMYSYPSRGPSYISTLHGLQFNVISSPDRQMSRSAKVRPAKVWPARCRPALGRLPSVRLGQILPCTLMPRRRCAACMHEFAWIFACMALLWLGLFVIWTWPSEGETRTDLPSPWKNEHLVSRPHRPPHINAEVQRPSRSIKKLVALLDSRMRRILHDSASLEVFFPSPISVICCQIAGPKTPAQWSKKNSGRPNSTTFLPRSLWTFMAFQLK